ncbi:DUF488 family protein [Streptomyces sp. NPDC047028]|uniref:DUF488 domain-containing protein n=1 Tax=Streptomyces sp. NPDC047028 TaxID=3155793 RepID=UPI0033D75143
MAKQITCRRVYEETAPGDGKRVLVDRIRPRGMRKEDARLDEWLRDVAPSSELRKWYGHKPSRFTKFLAAHEKLTLLTATKDVDHGQTAVLAEWLTRNR